MEAVLVHPGRGDPLGQVVQQFERRQEQFGAAVGSRPAEVADQRVFIQPPQPLLR